MSSDPDRDIVSFQCAYPGDLLVRGRVTMERTRFNALRLRHGVPRRRIKREFTISYLPRATPS